MESGKNPLCSWTLWAAFLVIVAQGVVPFVDVWISNHPGAFASLLSVVFALLRFKTNKPIVINLTLFGKK